MVWVARRLVVHYWSKLLALAHSTRFFARPALTMDSPGIEVKASSWDM
jgi:hypothetical protein